MFSDTYQYSRVSFSKALLPIDLQRHNFRSFPTVTKWFLVCINIEHVAKSNRTYVSDVYAASLTVKYFLVIRGWAGKLGKFSPIIFWTIQSNMHTRQC